MSAKTKTGLNLETVWLREYARTYQPTEAGFWFSPELLREKNTTLLDVRHAFSVGNVMLSDKLDGPGARWTVIGEDCDGRLLLMTVIVVSAELSVSLESLERLVEASKDGKNE